MAVSPDARHLYALSWDPGEHRVHRLVGWSLTADAELAFQTPVACVEQASGVAHAGCSAGRSWPAFRSSDAPGPEWGSIAVSDDGRHVYVSGFDAVTVFSRDLQTGALRQLAGSDGCVARNPAERPGCGQARGIRGAAELALSSDGLSVYVLSRGPRTAGVAAFARDGSTGALTQLAGQDGCMSTGLGGCGRGRQFNQPQDVVVAPDGEHVYVASANDSERGGGIATLTRDVRSGRLTQRSGHRGCSNERGTRGCARDRGIGARREIVVQASGRALYSIGIDRGEGPRVSAIRIDGSVRRSTAVAPFPRVAAGLDALAVDARGRVYAHWENGGLFVYAARRQGRRLRLVGCWLTQFAAAPCARADGLVGATFNFIVPAPDGRHAFINGDTGIATIELR